MSLSRFIPSSRTLVAFAVLANLAAVLPARGATVALWLFDEQEQLYPSSILNDAGPQNWFLVLGRGGEIVPGKFGRALRPVEPAPFNPTFKGRKNQEEFSNAGGYEFGLQAPPKKPGRKVEPMTWFNATFAATFVNGDEHLRRRPFGSPTQSDLNLGAGDFTVEFWLKADAPGAGEGAVVEVGSGPRGENDVDTRPTLAVSPDGLTWKRYPRPAYVPIGNFMGFEMRRPYVAFGMVRRGHELWQYTYTRSIYHDGYKKEGTEGSPPALVQRLSQRLDGFVSVDAPYEKEGGFTTHPLRFVGGQLVVNVDTGATGFMQIGFEDEHGKSVPGFSVDDCIYINGNMVEPKVCWLTKDNTITHDVSALAGRPVRMVVRMRGPLTTPGSS